MRVGLPEGSKSRAKAEEQGLRVVTPAEAAAEADVIMILAPDTAQRTIYAESIAPNLKAGKALFFGHGFNIRYGLITPPDGRRRGDGRAEGPRPPGAPPVRRRQGRAVPGRGRAGRRPAARRRSRCPTPRRSAAPAPGVIKTTFTEETETDLFGEQAVLCGGTSALVQTGFEVLTEAGYAPEIAYFECLHELKLIVDLMYEGGIANERYSISDTAEYGDLTRGPRVIDAAIKAEMKQDPRRDPGRHVRARVDRRGRRRPPELHQAAGARAQAHPIEEVGAKLRGMMSWVDRPITESRHRIASRGSGTIEPVLAAAGARRSFAASSALIMAHRSRRAVGSRVSAGDGARRSTSARADDRYRRARSAPDPPSRPGATALT